jgi:NADH-quinone oxidoreductase subunit J
MRAAFFILAVVTLIGAVGAIALRRLIHCALSAALAFAGLAGIYLMLGAEFVSFAQVLVYLGAVAVLIVFAILLTPPAAETRAQPFCKPCLLGLGVAVLVFGVVWSSVLASSVVWRPAATAVPASSAKLIGRALMTDAVLPLEVLGLLLTAALIGAVVLAWREKEGSD